jgi:hypothetical protein
LGGAAGIDADVSRTQLAIAVRQNQNRLREMANGPLGDGAVVVDQRDDISTRYSDGRRRRILSCRN